MWTRLSMLFCLFSCASVSSLDDLIFDFKKEYNEVRCDENHNNTYVLCTGSDQRGHLQLSLYSNHSKKEIYQRDMKAIGYAQWAGGDTIEVKVNKPLPDMKNAAYSHLLIVSEGGVSLINNSYEEN